MIKYFVPIERVIRLLLMFFVSSFYLKVLGAEFFGEYIRYYLIFFVVSVFVSYGSDLTFQSELAKKNSNVAKAFREVFTIRIYGCAIFSILSLFLYGLVYASIGGYEVGNSYIILMFLIVALFVNYSDIYEFFLMSREDYLIVVISRFFSIIILSVTKIYCIYNINNEIILMMSMLLDPIVYSLIFIVVMVVNKKINMNYFGLISIKWFSQYLSKNKDAFFSSCISMLYSKLDLIFVSVFFGESVIGLYGYMVRIYDSLSFLVSSILNVLSSRLIFYDFLCYEFYKIWRKIIALLVVGFVALVIIVWPVSIFVIETVMPSNEVMFMSDEVLLVLLMCIPFSQGAYVMSRVFLANGDQRYRLIRMGTSFFITILISVIVVINDGGVLYLVFGTLIGQIYAFFGSFISARYRGMLFFFRN